MAWEFPWAKYRATPPTLTDGDSVLPNADVNGNLKVNLDGTKVTAANLGAGGVGALGWLSQIAYNTSSSEGVATTVNINNTTLPLGQIPIYKQLNRTNASTNFTEVNNTTAVPVGWSPNTIDYTVGVTVNKSTNNTLVSLVSVTKDGATALVMGNYNLVASAGTTGGTIRFTYNGVVKDNIAPNTLGVFINGGAAGRITFDAGALPTGLPKTDVITVANNGNNFYFKGAVAEVLDDNSINMVVFQMVWGGRTRIARSAVSRGGGNSTLEIPSTIAIPNLTTITVNVRGNNASGMAQFIYWGTEAP